jgi:hypothetical protein
MRRAAVGKKSISPAVDPIDLDTPASPLRSGRRPKKPILIRLLIHLLSERASDFHQNYAKSAAIRAHFSWRRCAAARCARIDGTSAVLRTGAIN